MVPFNFKYYPRQSCPNVVLSRANVLTPVSLSELGVGSRYTVLVESRGRAPENFREIKAIYHIFLQYRHFKNINLKIDRRIKFTMVKPSSGSFMIGV